MCTIKHFYPRSPCGERPTKSDQGANSRAISIHALLAESDAEATHQAANGFAFLSTLSLRRATSIIDIINNVIDDFYPRSPCGERRARRASRQQPAGISIHALLAESDCQRYSVGYFGCHFYPRSPCGERLLGNAVAGLRTSFLSTLSLRRATHYGWSWYDDFTISIHALLAESDPTSYMPAIFDILFLSTLSLRRATIFAARHPAI